MSNVFLDSREPSHIKELFLKTFSTGEVTMLPVGDLVYPTNSVCCERKTVEDFISSVMGRLWVQLQNMIENYQHPYLIIVGRFDEEEVMKHTSFTRKQFLGACASISARYKIPVFNVDSNRDFFTLSKALMEKSDGSLKHLDKVRRLAVSDGDVLEAMVSCIPGIGLEYSKRIIDVLGVDSIIELCKTTVEDLMSVDGIGERKANNIKEYYFER